MSSAFRDCQLIDSVIFSAMGVILFVTEIVQFAMHFNRTPNYNLLFFPTVFKCSVISGVRSS